MNKKKNILEICNQLGIGGTEKTLQIFCKYLNKDKYNIYACGIFKGGEREKIIKLHVSDLLIANGNIDLIKKFILDNKIHIVHWHSITQNPGKEFEKSIELLKFLKSKNIKIIETSPFSLYNPKVDNLLDLKLFVSKTNLIKYFWKFGNKLKNKNKYSFLYNPLDIEELTKYILNGKQKQELKIKYGLNNNFIIGKVGRANLWKWDDTIIDIVPELIKKIPNLKVIIRAIPEIKKKKIQKMGIEKFFIFLPETVDEKVITETYQLMDTMVHTSRIGESFGVSLTEGMFFGLPIITKSSDFIKFTLFDRDNGQIEIVNDGKNGYIENTIEGAVNKISILYNNINLRQKISKYNNIYVINLFNAEKITKDLEQYFDHDIIKTNINYYQILKEYKNKIKKENLYNILNENIKAIINKFIHKA